MSREASSAVLRDFIEAKADWTADSAETVAEHGSGWAKYRVRAFTANSGLLLLLMKNGQYRPD